MTERKKEFGERVREARLECNLTQADLADLVGLSERQIRSIEKGVHDPSLKVALRLADALGISLQPEGIKQDS